jgi:hypothetical protein
MAEMLDNVLQYFIDNAPKPVARAIFSATQERSIGVGALGFHAYLQKHGLAFEGVLAKSANHFENLSDLIVSLFTYRVAISANSSASSIVSFFPLDILSK